MKLVVRAIIEMLGAPAEYIDKTLRHYVASLENDKPFKVIKKDFEEPKEQGQFFSAFVELEIEFNKMQDLFDFCLDSMPSSVEILEPDSLAIPTNEMNNYLNDLQSKLHENDMNVKRLKTANELLDKNSMVIFRNFILYLVKLGKCELSELSKFVGVPEDQLKPYLGKMVEENVLNVSDDKYSISERFEDKVET